jgi:nitroreductase
MDAIDAIMTRRSPRVWQKSKRVPAELVMKLLAAAMQAPSAGDGQPWHFVVIDDRDLLDQASRFYPGAAPARSAPMAILACGDLGEDRFGGYWEQDCAAAVENMLLAAHALGLGALWTGVYPLSERVHAFRKLLKLPSNVEVLAFVMVGYPDAVPPPEDRFRKNRIHHNGW